METITNTMWDIVIMAVEETVTINDISKAMAPYGFIESMHMEEFNTMAGGKYNRVYVSMQGWYNTEATNQFMNSIENGTARLNGWWDVRQYDVKYGIRRAVEKIEEEFENMSDITVSDQGDFTDADVSDIQLYQHFISQMLDDTEYRDILQSLEDDLEKMYLEELEEGEICEWEISGEELQKLCSQHVVV